MENWKVKSVDGVEVTPEAKQEEVVQDTVEQVVEETPQPVAEQQPYETPKNEAGDYKVSLDTPPVKEETPKVEEVKEEAPVEEISIEAVEPEKPVEAPVEEAPAAEIQLEDDLPTVTNTQAEELKLELPENVDKLVAFINETGGTVEDYVNLNKNVEEMDSIIAIREFYKSTKPHLDNSDIDFLMNQKFHYDEDIAEEGEVRAKQLAFKEELYNAQKHLRTQKDKYYADLKLNRNKNISPEARQAQEYYEQQQQQQIQNEKLVSDFHTKTDNLFNDDFKGFDFKVGDNKFRIKVGDVNKTREFQKDINNFANQFMGEDGTVSDANGYHKALFAAQNADRLAQHFYEQGRADAIKDSAAKAKNIDMKPRQDAASVVTQSGQKFRVVQSDDSSKLRIKMRK